MLTQRSSVIMASGLDVLLGAGTLEPRSQRQTHQRATRDNHSRSRMTTRR